MVQDDLDAVVEDADPEEELRFDDIGDFRQRILTPKDQRDKTTFQKIKSLYVDDGFSHNQFIVRKSNQPIPYKAIGLATFLLFAGVYMLYRGFYDLHGYLNYDKSMVRLDEVAILLVAGLLMLIPGLYHIHIAIRAYYRYEGYSFGDIPEFD